MTPANPFFEIGAPEPINDLERLLSLNVERTYFRPGDETPITDITSTLSSGHQTAGLFRGQIFNWPLVPKCFRNEDANEVGLADAVLMFRWFRATHRLRKFCERAEVQNPQFPAGFAERMSIAQHFGVETPLLDWSRNIFTALFFAIREVFSHPKFGDDPKVFLYHIRDERLLPAGLPHEEKISKYGRSAFVAPYFIDRRIERQRGAFTFHPHPAHRPEKVPAQAYVLEWDMVEKLLKLMKGFGFTEDYYFPDYGGIAAAVMSETSL